MFSDQGADQVCSGIVQPDKNKDRHDKERRVAHDTRVSPGSAPMKFNMEKEPAQ